jgi:hypothetical protein
MTNSHLSRVSGVEKAVKQLEVRNANRPLDDTGPFGRLEWLGKPVCLSYPDACSCQLYVSKKSRRHGVAKLTIVPNVPSSRLCKRGTATAIERLDMQKTENDVSELSVSSGASLRLAAALVWDTGIPFDLNLCARIRWSSQPCRDGLVFPTGWPTWEMSRETCLVPWSPAASSPWETHR